jgi:short-subunit dehydrogenase
MSYRGGAKMSKPLIVIVGAGPGVGSGVAKKFGTSGFRVVLIARTKERLEQFTSELEGRGVEAYGITANASDTDSLKAAFKQIKEIHGEVDVLVYNAAVTTFANPSVLTEQQLVDDFNINVTGALTSAQQVIPDMIERKQGTILLTGAVVALYPMAVMTSLSIGKAGMRTLAFTLSEELEPHGIFVSTVSIMGQVQRGTFFDPDSIAESFWELYMKRDKKEVIFGEQNMNITDISSSI